MSGVVHTPSAPSPCYPKLNNSNNNYNKKVVLRYLLRKEKQRKVCNNMKILGNIKWNYTNK